MTSDVLLIKNVSPLRGRVSIPGDKSISHRSVLLGALAEGKTTVRNFLLSDDCLHTVSCLRKLGADIQISSDTVTITGQGPEGLTEPGDVLDVGNSGTTLRLMAGILAGLGHYAVLTGDKSIRKRPMERIVRPLREMGAVISGRRQGKLAPLSILPGHVLCGIEYRTAVASAQVKSCIMLAGLFAKGQTSVVEPNKSRDHTERMLRQFGVKVEEEGNRVSVWGGSRLRGTTVDVPGDISSAAFILSAAALIPDSVVTVENVGLNPTRTGFLDVLRRMGAKITVSILPTSSNNLSEPTGNVTVEYGPLTGIEIGGEDVPRLIDEIPVIAVLAACARGKTVIKDAAELRFKESDRIATVCKELAKFGVKAVATPDGMEIMGTNRLTCPEVVDSYHDHRLAMSMSVLAARAVLFGNGPIAVNGAQTVNISFPGYEKVMRRLGIEMQTVPNKKDK